MEEKIASARGVKNANAKKKDANVRRVSVNVGMVNVNVYMVNVVMVNANADMERVSVDMVKVNVVMVNANADMEKVNAIMEKVNAIMEKVNAITVNANAIMEKVNAITVNANAITEKANAITERTTAKVDAVRNTRRKKRSALWESWNDPLVSNKHPLKWSRSSSSRVLRIPCCLSSLLMLLLLLLHNPLPTWNMRPLHPLALNWSKFPSSLSSVQCLFTGSETNIITLTTLIRQSLRNLEVGVISGLQYQEHLLGLGTAFHSTMPILPVWEVHH